MKSKKFFQSGKKLFLAVGILCTLQNRAIACGPFFEGDSRIYLFKSSWEGMGRRDMEKAENLVLWQNLTDASIPISDIEQAVYHDSLKELQVNYYSPYASGNQFYTHLYENKRADIMLLLGVAKRIQERREFFASPWYYPETEGDVWSSDDKSGDLDYMINLCHDKIDSRFRDRYGLQLVRALFSSRRYAQCIEAYEDAYATIPDDNLFKRMSEAYVAGCWSRLGEVDKANEYFAQAGDFHSLKTDDPLNFMAERNPDSPELMEYIQSCMNDSANVGDIELIAKQVVASKKSKNRGDWEFLLAYIAGEYHRDNATATRKINAALNYRFSTDDLRDHARAYRMKLDARQGIKSRLLDDLRWFASKAASEGEWSEEWKGILRNIVRTNWVPAMWKKGDYATAILMCGFMENLCSINGFVTYDAVSTSRYWAYATIGLREMRESIRYFNELDYSCTTFKLMESLTSKQLAEVKVQIDNSANPICAFMKKYARVDSDYFNELIGTLALREEDYTNAVRYLSMVSPDYQKTLNIYKEGYLIRNPFAVYPSRWRAYEWRSERKEYYYESQTIKAHMQEQTDAKLNFARQMQDYKRLMTTAPDADGRAMAQLMYAIGRRNSFEECWALTQYGRGCYLRDKEDIKYTTEYDNPYTDDNSVKYDFLYDYMLTAGPEQTEREYRRDVERALVAFDSDGARARAEYMMGNLKTVIKRLGNTDMADFVKMSCDRWKQWL